MAEPANPSDPTEQRHQPRWRALLGVLFLLTGLGWTVYAASNQVRPLPIAAPESVNELAPGTVAAMNSPAISYDAGWSVSSDGADPAEPADPWSQPSGVITFDYMGDELALNLNSGDYWGYLYVTIDGQPANLLPSIRGNVDSTGAPAGYRTLYEPDAHIDATQSSPWTLVHASQDSRGPHHARIEVWRAWGQTPIRGVAVDAMSTEPPTLWPGAALALFGLSLVWPFGARMIAQTQRTPLASKTRRRLRWLLLPQLSERFRLLAALVFFAATAAGVAISASVIALVGLFGLGLLSLARPALWTAALLVSLPFYFAYAVPLLPVMTVGLIDTFVLFGLVVAVLNRLLTPPRPREEPTNKLRGTMAALFVIIIAWAFVAAFSAQRIDLALYEWRTVFLYAGLFAVILVASLRQPATQTADLWLITSAWIAGGAAVSLIGLGQYVTGSMLTSAEGVTRIRALYGSPNNLALYLERTFIVTLALAALLPANRMRLVWVFAAAVQGAALLLTFSKGAIFLGIPAGLLTLWIGGMALLPLQGRSRRPLMWLAGIFVVFALALLPFLGRERFSGMLDLSQGTGYMRMQLWRSAWQMALEHPLLGVGPDNFLYEYRSLYLLPEAWQEPNLNHPHNWLLDWWTRIGLPGLIAASALITLGMVRLWNVSLQASQGRQPVAILSLGYFAAAVAALTHGLIDASYALPDLAIAWVLLFMATTALPEVSGTQPERGIG